MHYSFGNWIIKEAPDSLLMTFLSLESFYQCYSQISFLSSVVHTEYISNPN